MIETPLTTGALVILVGASLAFTALATVLFRRDPARRKVSLICLMIALLMGPWWAAAGGWTWPVAMGDSARWLLTQQVSWGLAAFWWAVGAALMVRTAVRVGLARRTLMALPQQQDPALLAEVLQVSRAAGLAHPPAVRTGPWPCASSLGSAALVLPAGVCSWPATTRRAVLAHETAHLKRLDDRMLLLVRLMADWYWWLPWLRRVHGRYLQAMEESCDDLASRLLPGRADYAAGLIDAARRLGATGRSRRAAEPAAAAPAWVSLLGHSHLAQRIYRLVNVPHPTLQVADGRWALFWTTLLFALLLTARPSAPSGGLAADAHLRPLTTQDPDSGATTAALPHVAVESRLFDPRTGAWQRLPASARDPMPVYPAEALESGLGGRVTVDTVLRVTATGLQPSHRPPAIRSSETGGALAAAVERALSLSQQQGRTVSAGTARGRPLDLPPPGAEVRLRRIYRFIHPPGPGPLIHSGD